MKYITVDPKVAVKSAFHSGEGERVQEIRIFWPLIEKEVCNTYGSASGWGKLSPYIAVDAIWNAGRIQGIREERAKRKAKRVIEPVFRTPEELAKEATV